MNGIIVIGSGAYWILTTNYAKIPPPPLPAATRAEQNGNFLVSLAPKAGMVVVFTFLDGSRYLIWFCNLITWKWNVPKNWFLWLHVQVDLAHMLAARDQELRTLTAEVIPVDSFPLVHLTVPQMFVPVVVFDFKVARVSWCLLICI